MTAPTKGTLPGVQQEVVLAAEGVSVQYGGNIALSDVSWEIRRGEILGIIGPNGAGKSTMLKAIAGLQKVTSGRIALNGVDVTRKSFANRSRQGCALTFQIPRNAPELTIEEELLAQYRGLGHIRSPRSRSKLNEIRLLLDEMNLLDVARTPIGQLTLGEIRRFEVARAVMNTPTVLLVDEPSSGMSAAETRVLGRELRRVSANGVAVVLVEHNIPFIAALTGQVLVIESGRQLIHGPTDVVLQSDEVREAYLGTAATER